jgi:small subunit ribosomal protein S13
MVRIAGVDLPNDKRIEVALAYIYGVGPAMSKKLLKETGINPDTLAKDVSEGDIVKIREWLRDTPIEGDLRREISLNIKRLMEIGCYRGQRHRKSLPTRGQRTRTNARTNRKGGRKTVANKKKVTK